MNRRERTLTISVGGLVGVVVIWFGATKLFTNPASDLRALSDSLRTENLRLTAESKRLSALPSEITATASMVFADERSLAQIRLREHLDRVARAAGLEQSQYTLTAASASPKSGIYEDICWQMDVSRDGVGLDRLVNLLYLLEKDSRLGRITGFSVSPKAGGAKVGFTLKYSTLALDAKVLALAKGRKSPSTQPVELASLTEPARADYDVIVRRNFFQPKAKPANVATGGQPRNPNNNTQPQQGDPQPTEDAIESLRVTSLSAPTGEPEVELHSGNGGPLYKILKVGDDLPRLGKVAAVDYREMPDPEKPGQYTPSRVIFRVESAYWTVDLGKSLRHRRVMKPEDLPEALRGTVTTMPSK